MGFDDNDIADCKASHRPTTWRGDRHAFRLFAESSAKLQLSLVRATSKDNAFNILAAVFSSLTHTLSVPLSACTKMRGSLTWLINYAWDPQWRMRCSLRAAQRQRPVIEPAPSEDCDVTLLLGLLALPRWQATIPNSNVPLITATSDRGVTLTVVFTGCRPIEAARMSWDLWTRTDEYHEFIIEVKNQQKLQRVRLFRLLDSPLDPYHALDEVYEQETHKHRRLFHRTAPVGPVWTDINGKAYDSTKVSAAISRVLKCAGLPANKPYRVKAWTVTALRLAGVPLEQIAKFIRHSVASGNLDKYYVVNDKGRSCSEKIKQLASAAAI
jgi:hypothetical protein